MSVYIKIKIVRKLTMKKILALLPAVILALDALSANK